MFGYKKLKKRLILLEDLLGYSWSMENEWYDSLRSGVTHELESKIEEIIRHLDIEVVYDGDGKYKIKKIKKS